MAPVTLCVTVLSDNAARFLLSLIVVIITLLALTDRPNVVSIKSLADLLSIEMTGKRPFVTNYRAFVNAGSAVCILAVDFVVFPRRLCKTETYGTGLMDAGVACYVFANAIVSPEARGHIIRYLMVIAFFCTCLLMFLFTTFCWVSFYCFNVCHGLCAYSCRNVVICSN